MKQTFPIGKYVFDVDFDFEKKYASYKEITLPDLTGYVDLANGKASTPKLLEDIAPLHGKALQTLVEKIKDKLSTA